MNSDGEALLIILKRWDEIRVWLSGTQRKWGIWPRYPLSGSLAAWLSLDFLLFCDFFPLQ